MRKFSCCDVHHVHAKNNHHFALALPTFWPTSSLGPAISSRQLHLRGNKGAQLIPGPGCQEALRPKQAPRDEERHQRQDKTFTAQSGSVPTCITPGGTCVWLSRQSPKFEISRPHIAQVDSPSQQKPRTPKGENFGFKKISKAGKKVCKQLNVCLMFSRLISKKHQLFDYQ